MSHIDIADPSVIAIPIKDTGERLISVEGLIEIGPPAESSATQEHYHLLRESVVKKLIRAQSHLPTGLRFRIYEGYRCPRFQSELFEQQLTRELAINPLLTSEEAFKNASLLVAPVTTYEGKTLSPPHSTGGALDIEIVNTSGQVLDFGMEIKEWSTVPAELCETKTPNLSSLALSNRNLLCSVLQAEGFVNYTREWWHFSYGDQYWLM
ncbi:M15 family metallopeptidase [Vibrio mexicanus]|uniref:M15 family metallopeptidase n=1 Tax=Vibrio mexicanus TaxID=1004326 RepID=UPI00069C20B8|nr:M15 family metallopeptidase [Vibrio mexicanus]